jgi:Flp pilus assembly protein TadD
MAGQKLEKAEKQLETGVLLMPGHIGSWHALAWCRIALSNLSGAEEAFEKSKSIDPNFGETYGGLAVIAVLLGDLEKARTLVRKALRLNKASFAANFANSLMLMKTGNEKVGQENIENLLNTPVDSKGETMIQKINKILSNQDG